MPLQRALEHIKVTFTKLPFVFPSHYNCMQVAIGLRQGAAVSPILYSVAFKDIIQSCNLCHLSLYVKIGDLHLDNEIMAFDRY